MTNPPLLPLGDRIRAPEGTPAEAGEGTREGRDTRPDERKPTGSSGPGVRRREEQRPGTRPSTGARPGRVGVPGRVRTLRTST